MHNLRGAIHTPPFIASINAYLDLFDLERGVYAMTLVYTAIQLAYTLWKWWRDLRSGRNKKENQ